MEPHDFKARVEEIKRRASGRWTKLLRALRVSEAILNRRNGPCPGCGGEDRFQYTDKFGQGDYHCRGCGHGDGFTLLRHVHGWDFATAWRHVESLVGGQPPAPMARPTEPSSVHLSTGKPVWSAIAAGSLERLWLPESVRRVCIYADNDADADFDGQAGAFALARRLKKEQKKTGARQVSVFVPKVAGNDWADVWCARIRDVEQAA